MASPRLLPSLLRDLPSPPDVLAPRNATIPNRKKKAAPPKSPISSRAPEAKMQASMTQKPCTNAAQIETSITTESASGPFRYAELLQSGKIQNLRRTFFCCAINLLQQFTSAKMINYYAPVVYASITNLSRTLSLILSGCTSLAYLFASFIPL